MLEWGAAWPRLNSNEFSYGEGATMRTIEADITKPKGPRDAAFRRSVGAGHAYLGLRADYREQLAMAREECGFETIRFHGILHDDMGVYREDDGKPVYGWQYVDSLYDFFLDIGIKPFVEFSFMPAALASGDQLLFSWRANVTPPASVEKWGALIHEAVRHWEQRYGRKELETWYFEAWNEPDQPGFWSGTMEDYFALYAATAKAVKDVSATYRVGGPATAGLAWIDETIDFCVNGDVPIDFISSHMYGVLGAFDPEGSVQFNLDTHPRVLWGPVREMHERIRASAKPDLEFHITEWSTSYSSRDPVHDNYRGPSFLLDKLKKAEGCFDSMAYWGFSDVFEELRAPTRPFHGGFGLLNLQSLKKPAYIMYEWLNRLGDTELGCGDEAAWVCAGDDGVQALFWDYTPVEQDVFNGEYFTRDLPAGELEPVRLSLSGLAPGEHELRIHRIGHRSNDVYADFLDMGSPRTLSRAEVERLAADNDGGPESVETVVVGADGRFETDIPMREHDVVMAAIKSC